MSEVGCPPSAIHEDRGSAFLCQRQKSRRSSSSDQPGGVLLVQPARFVVEMVNRIFDTQDSSKTDIASLKQTTPVVAGIACEQLRKPCLQAAPLIAIVLCGWINVVELQFLQEQSVELRFQRRL